MDQTQLVNDLIVITSRLIALMTTEIEKLRAHEIDAVEALQREKVGLANAYETLIRELRRHSGILQELEPALRDELVAKAGEFQSLLVRNEAALRAAKDVNARVLQAIADAVIESQKQHVSYSRSGKKQGTRVGREVGVSMTLNRTL
jgi:hypothetical protein